MWKIWPTPYKGKFVGSNPAPATTVLRELMPYLPCPYCDNEPGGCCACDHFGVVPEGHPLYEAEPIEGESE